MLAWGSAFRRLFHFSSYADQVKSICTNSEISRTKNTSSHQLIQFQTVIHHFLLGIRIVALMVVDLYQLKYRLINHVILTNYSILTCMPRGWTCVVLSLLSISSTLELPPWLKMTERLSVRTEVVTDWRSSLISLLSLLSVTSVASLISFICYSNVFTFFHFCRLC